MDPVTAFLLAVKAFCEMVTEIERGQPIESRAAAWARWDKFVAGIERWFPAPK